MCVGGVMKGAAACARAECACVLERMCACVFWVCLAIGGHRVLSVFRSSVGGGGCVSGASLHLRVVARVVRLE